ncbi:hypothetical protein ASF53_12820 [Methylobacterium sp. Leaf123]|uniref:hypothetical protein n=1 Tax=Methylobacterium sp. Leaf123 TaxID=1736264 RepID=UPI0006F53724|nr:hypothetical protein [Methylobacterium sp. Leaf123]KQQ13077.1 hypothetical protein ASF53_12820 [Methylobacterium sp. Leaf123]
MEAPGTKPPTELGDETFLSAAELAGYAAALRAAQAMRDMQGDDRAAEARAELMKSLSQPIELTADRMQEITKLLLHKLRIAAEQGKKELLVMRFPNAMCSDGGRAINNCDTDWPETLTGRARQAYEFWRDRLQGAGYGLRAMIVDWPNGMPGDVGFFLDWDTRPPT